jgi:hypothetical protein
VKKYLSNKNRGKNDVEKKRTRMKVAEGSLEGGRRD